MNKPTTPIGSQIDADLRVSARSVTITGRGLRTVEELLTAISETAPNLPIGMLRSTANHISTFLNVPLEQLAIDALENLGVAASHLSSLRAALMPAAIRPGAREHTQAISTLSFAHVSFSTAQNATT